MATPRIDVKKVGDVTIVLCRDVKLNDDLVIQEWGEQLMELLDKNEKKLVINFERILFMSSSTLRVLITLNKKAKELDVVLLLCGIDDNLMEAFRITRLDTVFQIKKNEEEAIRFLTMQTK